MSAKLGKLLRGEADHNVLIRLPKSLHDEGKSAAKAADKAYNSWVLDLMYHELGYTIGEVPTAWAQAWIKPNEPLPSEPSMRSDS